MSAIARSATAVACVASLAGCATPLAWPPTVQRLPETAVSESASAPREGPANIAKPVPVTFDEMVAMAQAGTPSSVIIQKLRDSRLIYSVNDEEAASLTAKGVPDDVIAYLRQGEAGLPPHQQAVPPAYRTYPYGPPYTSPSYPYYSAPYYGSFYYGRPYYARPYYGYGYPYGFLGLGSFGASIGFGFRFHR